jgi:DNA-binding PadR family transcriptional regulator
MSGRCMGDGRLAFLARGTTSCIATCYVVLSRPMAKRKLGGDYRRPNDPPILILTSLAAGAKHGHALAKDIEGFAGVTLGPGALYGAITRLEERGLIAPLESEDRRRPYEITSSGREALAAAVREMRVVADEATSRLGLSLPQLGLRRV